jgi:hypothetical protein
MQQKPSTIFFVVLHYFTNGKFILAIQTGKIRVQFFLNFYHIQNFHFLTIGKDTMASLTLRSTTSITTLKLLGHY